MAVSIHVETQDEHQYVVHLQDGEEKGESWFNITPGVLEELHGGEVDERDCVRRTAEFLLGHQSVGDFPDIVELEDIIATYDDYANFMKLGSGT